MKQVIFSEKAPAAVGPYSHAIDCGDLVFLSGHIAKRDGKVWTGHLGADMTTADGAQAARAVAIDLMGTLQAACGGDLSRVRRIVKVVSLVQSAPGYNEQHLVTNGCSELLAEVVGAAGQHARSAFGVPELPLGACVEIELVAELG